MALPNLSLLEWELNQNCYLIPKNAPIYHYMQREAGPSIGQFYYIKLDGTPRPVPRAITIGTNEEEIAAYCHAIKKVLDDKPTIASKPAMIIGLPEECVQRLTEILDESHPACTIRTQQEFIQVASLRTHQPHGHKR